MKEYYKKHQFNPDEERSVSITVIGRDFSTAINGTVSGELLIKLENVIAEVYDYVVDSKPEPAEDTPYRIWWKKVDKDGNVVDHGVHPNPYKRESTAKAKALVKYGFEDSPYVYVVSQSVAWPELGYFKIATYSNK